MSVEPASFLRALWRELFGQPPAISGEPELLARVLVDCLPPAPPYCLDEAVDAPSRAPPSHRSPRPGPSGPDTVRGTLDAGP